MKLFLNPMTYFRILHSKDFSQQSFLATFFHTGSSQKDRTGQFAISGLNSTYKNAIQWL